MQRLSAVDPAQTDGEIKTVLDGVAKALGLTPNMVKTMATSPALLQSYIAFNKTLAAGKLDAKVREQIALTIAAANGCDYCASAHTTLGKHAGVSAEDLIAGLQAHSRDAKIDAALKFARRVNETRGEVTDADLAKVRAAGWGDSEIGEIVGNVALNVLTNYFNNVVRTEIDFPLVHARQVA